MVDTTGKRNQEEPRAIWVVEADSPITHLEMATNGSTLVIATQANKVALIDHDGEVRWNREFDRPVVGVDLSSLGTTVVVGLRTGEIYCLDEDGEELWSYNIHARLEDIHISRSGRYIVVASRDTYTYFFDSTGLLLWRSKADSRIREVATSTSANYVVSASASKDIFLHDNYSSNMKGAVTWRHTLGGDITSLAISSDGHFIAAGATDNMFYYFDKLGKMHWKHNVENKINSIALAPRGDFIALAVDGGGTYPGQVSLYSQKQGLQWRYLTGSGGVRDVDITTNGRYIVAGTGDGILSLFHSSEKLLWKRKLDSAVVKVRISARGRNMVAATESGKLHLYNTTDFLLKRQAHPQGLDELSDVIFTKPQQPVRKKAVVAEGQGGIEMGRTSVAQGQVKAPAPQGHPTVRTLSPRFSISRYYLTLFLFLVMCFIGFFSFVPVGSAGEFLIQWQIGVFLIIILAIIMLTALISRE